jgi:hypothetical protein
VDKKIISQKSLCELVLRAFEVGIIDMTDGEVSLVKAMKEKQKPFKDIYVAVLRALIERAGKKEQNNEIHKGNNR